ATLLAVGVLTALEAREQTGVGQRVDTSLLMAGIHLLRFDIYTAVNIGAPYERFNRARAYNPLWNYYRCADDAWVMLAMPFPDALRPPRDRRAARARLACPAERDPGDPARAGSAPRRA